MGQKSQFHRWLIMTSGCTHGLKKTAEDNGHLFPLTKRNKEEQSYYLKDSKCAFFLNWRIPEPPPFGKYVAIFGWFPNIWIFAAGLSAHKTTTTKKNNDHRIVFLASERNYTPENQKIGPWKVGQSFLEPIPLPFIIGRPNLFVVVCFEGNFGEQTTRENSTRVLQHRATQVSSSCDRMIWWKQPFWSKGIFGILYP